MALQTRNLVLQRRRFTRFEEVTWFCVTVVAPTCGAILVGISVVREQQVWGVLGLSCLALSWIAFMLARRIGRARLLRSGGLPCSRCRYVLRDAGSSLCSECGNRCEAGLLADYWIGLYALSANEAKAILRISPRQCDAQAHVHTKP